MNPIRIDIQNNLNRINEILTHCNKLDVTVSKCIWETKNIQLEKKAINLLINLTSRWKKLTQKIKQYKQQKT